MFWDLHVPPAKVKEHQNLAKSSNTISVISLTGKMTRPVYGFNVVSPHTEKTGELPTSLPMGCTWSTEWAARGLLSRQPTASKY